MSINKTALVIGGTGMLAELVVKLADKYHVVGVIARDLNRLNALTYRSEKVVPIQSDYTNRNLFEESIESFTKKYGKPTLIVSWIHSTSPDTPVLVADYCGKDFYDVTGMSGSEPTHVSHANELKIKSKGIAYHRVILAQIDGRWLTNKEISNGAHDAIQSGKDEFIVGTL